MLFGRKEKKFGILGIFAAFDDLMNAIRVLRESPLKIHEAFSPTPNDEIMEALEIKRSRVPAFSLLGGITGAVAGYALSGLTALVWKFDVWGKPVLAWVPFSVIAYEFSVLAAFLFTFIGMLILSRTPQRSLPPYYDPRFGVDHFGLLVVCSEADREKLASLFQSLGATEIKETHDIE